MQPTTQTPPPHQPSVDELIAAESAARWNCEHESELAKQSAFTRLASGLAASKRPLIAIAVLVLLVAGSAGALSLQRKSAADASQSALPTTGPSQTSGSGWITEDLSPDTQTDIGKTTTGDSGAQSKTGTTQDSTKKSTSGGTTTSPNTSTQQKTTTPSTPSTSTNKGATTPTTPTPTPTPTPAPAPAAPTGPLQPYGLGFAPYAYIPWGTSISVARGGSGAKNMVAAFVLSAGSHSCTPAWDGDSSLGINSSRGNQIASDFTAVRAAGADVVLSFGGASGTELAIGCTSQSSLQSAYQSVITKYNLTKIDFDIEGSAVTNSAANTRRAGALLALQKANPQLKIWLTLAVEQNGIPSSSLALVRQMRDTGVIIAGVNIMAMDYGTGVTNMGQAAINAANATFSQLKALFPAVSDAVVWKAIGITVMIGINDTKPETFTLANATQLRTYAGQKGIGMLSYWNTDRDKACPGNAATLSDTCSGVKQSTWQFAQSLMLQPSN